MKFLAGRMRQEESCPGQADSWTVREADRVEEDAHLFVKILEFFTYSTHILSYTHRSKIFLTGMQDKISVLKYYIYRMG